jgi:hypothetical protein
MMPRTEYSTRRRFVSDDVGEHVWTSALVNEARVLLYDLTTSCRKSPGERHLSRPTSRSGGDKKRPACAETALRVGAYLAPTHVRLYRRDDGQDDIFR